MTVYTVRYMERETFDDALFIITDTPMRSIAHVFDATANWLPCHTPQLHMTHVLGQFAAAIALYERGL